MEMDIQKAGDNSTQVQASVFNVYNGITEQRAREICKEEFAKIQELTQEAKQLAIQRVCELENRVIPKLSQIDKGLDFFSNPDFQFLLMEAQKAAARSERPVDYDLLSELLLHRVKNDNDREKRLGIKKAVEIIDIISDEALLGLTILHSVTAFIPNNGDVDLGLDILDGLFQKVICGELPIGNHWLDHLDLLGAIRVDSPMELKPICEYYSERLEGYVCTGINKESDDYLKALRLLTEMKIPNDILVDNVLNPGYVRLQINNQRSINSMYRFIAPNVRIPLTMEEIATLNEIFTMYNKDANLIQRVKQNFSEKWMRRKTLRQLKEWWEKIPCAITITEVGKVLAHVNAQRCDSSLPPLN